MLLYRTRLPIYPDYQIYCLDLPKRCGSESIKHSTDEDAMGEFTMCKQS